MEIVTSWQALMQRDEEVGGAKKSGDKARVEKVEKKYKEYKDINLP